MAKIIGRLSKQQLEKNIRMRSLLISRRIKTKGKKLGSVILRDVKGFPFSWARCDVYLSQNGLYAIRNGMFIRHLPKRILKDETFQNTA